MSSNTPYRRGIQVAEKRCRLAFQVMKSEPGLPDPVLSYPFHNNSAEHLDDAWEPSYLMNAFSFAEDV